MTKRKPRHVAHDALKSLRSDMMDAAPAPAGNPGMIFDGFENFVSQIGTPKDKAFSNSYSVDYFDPRALEAMYRGSWIGRKIIDVPTDDMTREWREWQVDEADKKKIRAAEAKFSVREIVREAVRMSRLFGSSAIIVGCKQDMEHPENPINIDQIKPGDLTYMHVAFAPYLSIFEWEDDVRLSNFGQPRLYHYSPFFHRTGGTFIEIHASRVIPFSGTMLPPYAMLAGNAWGDSVFQAISDTVKTASSITGVIASLVHESKIDVFSIPNLTNYLSTADGERKLLKRFTTANMLKSVNNAILLAADEQYDQKQISFAGLSDIHLRILQEVSGAADIPATRLLGQSPAGMNATGESDLRNYYDSIGAKQKTDLKPRLDMIDKLVLMSEGINLPEGTEYHFRSLWQETPEQRATMAFQKAQAAAEIAATNLISREILSEAVISQMSADGVFPGMADAVRDAKAANKPTIGELPAIPDPAMAGKKPGDTMLGRPALKLVKGGKPAPNNQLDRASLRDARPRTLYVSRPVLNGAEIIKWARKQGLKSTLKAADLHVTIAYSKELVDWMQAGSDVARIEIPEGGPRLIERFDGGAVVLLIPAGYDLRWRHERFLDIGASWDYPDYQPHITLTYDPGLIDVSKIEPYQGEIILGPERFAEIDDTAV